jgi:hypothetical protein
MVNMLPRKIDRFPHSRWSFPPNSASESAARPRKAGCRNLLSPGGYTADRPFIRLAIKLKANKTIKTKNRILAIPAALAAIPPKPNAAAINAKTKKLSAHDNMMIVPI